MRPKRALILGFFVVLFVLHQDFWWRDDPTLVLGVMPVSLAFHVVWTLLVAFGWWLVARFCWPHELDDGQPVPPASRQNPAPSRTAERAPR